MQLNGFSRSGRQFLATRMMTRAGIRFSQWHHREVASGGLLQHWLRSREAFLVVGDIFAARSGKWHHREVVGGGLLQHWLRSREAFLVMGDIFAARSGKWHHREVVGGGLLQHWLRSREAFLVMGDIFAARSGKWHHRRPVDTRLALRIVRNADCVIERVCGNCTDCCRFRYASAIIALRSGQLPGITAWAVEEFVVGLVGERPRLGIPAK